MASKTNWVYGVFKYLNPWRYRSPRNFFIMFAVVITLAVAIPFSLMTGLSWLFAYLIGINLATFCLYGYDKLSAKREWLRVPEIVLHGCAVVGGTPAAWGGQQLFRHKTIKGPFVAVFWVTVGIQIVLIGWLWWNYLG